MPRPCDSCSGRSVIYLRYSGQHLCTDHFLKDVMRRYKRELRAHDAFGRKGTIGIAVSGGKDSLLCLSLMHELSYGIKDVSLRALTVDEGIDGYRQSSVALSRQVCDDLDIPLDVIGFRELYGKDLDEMVRGSGSNPCTICGILRRRTMNSWAREHGCSLLLTGHNLDDMAQTVLMNVMSADLDRLLRLGPHTSTIEGFVPRCMPLRTVPETETHLAAMLRKLPIHEVECPYSVSAKRGLFRDLVLEAEDQIPGTRHMLLRFHQSLLAGRTGCPLATKPCTRCSEPVIGVDGSGLCKACELLNGLVGH